MSYSDSFPTQRPSLNLVFNGGSDQLDSRISFSRADTPPTYAAPSAVHYWSNEKHLSTENLVTQSDGSDWSFASSEFSKTASQSAPDGSTNGTKFSEKAAGSRAYIVTSNSCVPTVNQEITFAVWLKQTSGSRDYHQLRAGGIGSGKAFATFNLSNGTVDETGGTLGVSASVNAGPTGWYQCILKFTPTATTAITINLAPASASGGELPSVTGDTANSVTLFGAVVSNCGTVLNETSGSIHREFASTLKSVANAGDPRFEYDPASDGQSVAKGLLIEQQFTQYAHYSEQFDNNGGWAKVNATVQPNAAVAPDGTLSADLLVEADEASGTNSHYAKQNTLSSVAVGDTYTWTVFAKAAGRNYATIYTTVGGANTYGIWNLLDGSVTTTSGSGSFSSSDCGNGWYRLQITFTTTSTSGGSTYFYVASDGSTFGYPGNGYGSVLLWGANLTKTASSTSYVKSESTTVTKSADSCSVDLSQTSYQGGPVSIVAETPAGAGEGFIPYLFSLSGGDQNFYAFKNTTTASASDDWRYQVGGTGTTVSGSAGSDKIAIRWDTADVKAQFSAGVSSTNSGAVETAFTTLKIGMSPANLYQLNGNFKRVSLFNVALSDTELAALVD